MNLEQEIEHLIDRTIAEDLGKGDITTLACIPEAATTIGKLVLKQSAVLAGLPFLKTYYQKLDPKLQVALLVEEGSFQKAGTVIAKVSGPARSILSGERGILNLIQHASGVASTTAAYVRKVAGYKCAILDTRKTLPGLRALEKYAVGVGGGKNHRFSLDDRFIIKNNHLAFMNAYSGASISDAVAQVQAFRPGYVIEVEIEEIEQLSEALQTDAEAIMLRNMTPDEIEECVAMIRETPKKVYVESAIITLDTIRAYAKTGVDAISIASLTHSVKDVDIGMKLNPTMSAHALETH